MNVSSRTRLVLPDRSAGPVRNRRSIVGAATTVLILGAVAVAGGCTPSEPRERTDVSRSSPAATSPPSGPRSFHAFGRVTVRTGFNVEGAGQNVDSIAFWEGPAPSRSLMFVTSKNAPLVEIWRYPFSDPAESTALMDSCLEASADSATNGVVVDQEADLLYVASNFSPNVCVFSLPELAHVRTITASADYGREPNLALMELSSGAKRLYVSDDSEVYVHDATTQELLSQFTPTTGLETMWGDSYHQVLYIPDENGRTGIHAYDPDGSTYTRQGRNILGNSTIFDSDAEGILEYTCPASGGADTGAGLIVVSDQIDSPTAGNDYEVFDRETWRHLGTIQLQLPDETGYVYNTDGIGATQQASRQFPGGLFAAIHNDDSVVGVGWTETFDTISAVTGNRFGCGN
jgi:myo-inositol-hexaphosphate 3-phosphohydrolase